MTSKDSEVNKGDHRLIPEARVGASLGLVLGISLGLGPGPVLEANLGTKQGPTVKAAIMVTHGVCVPGPQMDCCLEGE